MYCKSTFISILAIFDHFWPWKIITRVTFDHIWPLMTIFLMFLSILNDCIFSLCILRSSSRWIRAKKMFWYLNQFYNGRNFGGLLYRLLGSATVVKVISIRLYIINSKFTWFLGPCKSCSDTCTWSTKWMSNRNSTTMRIHNFSFNAKSLFNANNNRCKSFVDFLKCIVWSQRW